MNDALRVTEYTYTTLPDDDVNCTVWRVKIEWRGPGDVWAVTSLLGCWNIETGWDWEPSPSNRDDDFKRTHRFTLDEAKAIVHEVFRDHLIINSMWVRNGKVVRAS